MAKFLHVKMVTRNQLIALLAIAGLVCTVAKLTGTTTAFARSHIHLWLPYGAPAHLWSSGSAPGLVGQQTFSADQALKLQPTLRFGRLEHVTPPENLVCRIRTKCCYCCI
jgi:hypothetical protein